MSEGGATAVEEALRIHPTWINGGGDLPGPGRRGHRRRHGRRLRALPPRALLPHGLGVHVRRARRAGPGVRSGSRRAERVSGPFREWRAPFGAMSAANWIGMNANQYLHRYGAPREMLGLIAVNARRNAAQNPARHLPGPDDDGRLPLGAAHHVAVRSLRL